MARPRRFERVAFALAPGTIDLGMAALSRTLLATKKAPGPLVGTLESRDSKNDELSVG